jgi:hypothetical protein
MRGIGRGLLLALAVALFSAPVIATTRQDEETVAIAIEAGRLDAMMDSVGRVLRIHGPRDLDPRASYEPRTYIAFSLKRAVSQYNRLMPVACARHLMTGGRCGRRYEPIWLQRLSDRDTDAILQAHVDDAAKPIEALWTALCGHRSIARGQRDACEIE